MNTKAVHAENAYRFGPGDVLSITVFGQPALSGNFRISLEGYISFPLLGEVAVTNLTRSELEAKLGGLLSQQMPGTGRISTAVAEYAPVFILGDVEKPGRYEFRPGMIPLELLAIGGGMKRLTLDPQRDPTLQLIELERDLSDLRLVRYRQAVTRARLLCEIASRDFDGKIDPADDQPIMLARKKRIVDDEVALFRVRADVLANREKALKQQEDSYNDEITALTQSIALRDQEIALLQREVNTTQGLAERGLTAEPKLLALRREFSAAQRGALEQRSFLARAHQRQLAVRLQIEELHHVRANELAQSLRQLDLEIAQTDEKLAATGSTLSAMRSTDDRRQQSEPAPTTFEVIRLVDGEYRSTQIGERDPLKPRDILQVKRHIAGLTRQFTDGSVPASPPLAATAQTAVTSH